MTDYTAQILGLTGDEPPLTPTDERAAIRFAFAGWQGEWLLAGDDRAHHVRSRDGGSAGWLTDHTSVSVNYSRSGLLIHVSDHTEGRTHHARPRPAPAAVRVGHITWRTAEAILRAAAEPEQLELEVTR